MIFANETRNNLVNGSGYNKVNELYQIIWWLFVGIQQQSWLNFKFCL